MTTNLFDDNQHLYNSFKSYNTAYTDFIAKISKVKTTATDIQGGLTSIEDIKKNHNNNQNLRSELDMKLQDLYSIQDSLPVMNQTIVDSTTFAFMLWVVLASTMLLYVFTRSIS